MRPKTLEQRRFGDGIRPGLLRTVAQPWAGCAAEVAGHPCTGEVAGSIELYVDATPPDGRDWYEKLLAILPPNAWARCRFCMPHLEEICMRSIDVMESPDSWAPGMESPHVLPRPPKLIQA